ncbi:MAG: hypothetical protein ACREVI_10505 [Steroidobacteraceae bacterium]
MPEIQRADPVLRRRALIAAVAIAAVGWAAFFVLQAWLVDIRDADLADAREKLEQGLVWGSWAVALPVAMLAVYLWQLGARVLRAGRYPLPGASVIRDTPVLAGREARRRGIVLQALAVLLGLLIAVMLVSVHRLVARLGQARTSAAIGQPMITIARGE